jgi:hypothetical protein
MKKLYYKIKFGKGCIKIRDINLDRLNSRCSGEEFNKNYIRISDIGMEFMSDIYYVWYQLKKENKYYKRMC